MGSKNRSCFISLNKHEETVPFQTCFADHICSYANECWANLYCGSQPSDYPNEQQPAAVDKRPICPFDLGLFHVPRAEDLGLLRFSDRHLWHAVAHSKVSSLPSSYLHGAGAAVSTTALNQMPSGAKRRRRTVGRARQRRAFVAETLIGKPLASRHESTTLRETLGTSDQRKQRTSDETKRSTTNSAFSALGDALRLIQEAQRAAPQGTTSSVRAVGGSQLSVTGRSARNDSATPRIVTDSRASLQPIELVLCSERFRLDPLGALTEAIWSQR
jgi:hypothetical protein